MQEERPEAEHGSYSLRELMGAVNLGDFVRMVWAELGMIASSVRLSFASLSRLPFGPFAFLVGMFLVWLRLGLLFLVVVAFGSFILLVTAFRAATKLAPRRPGPDQSPPDHQPDS